MLPAFEPIRFRSYRPNAHKHRHRPHQAVRTGAGKIPFEPVKNL